MTGRRLHPTEIEALLVDIQPGSWAPFINEERGFLSVIRLDDDGSGTVVVTIPLGGSSKPIVRLIAAAPDLASTALVEADDIERLTDALISIVNVRTDALDSDETGDWRLVARKMESIARTALGWPT